MHTAIQKLNDLEGYSEAEIVAARGAANYLGIIESGETLGDPTYEEQDDGTLIQYLEPGTLRRLKKGEKVTFNTPNRPNAALDPFMRYMLREIAAGVPVSYEALSRDYSQSNYSSSRLSLLDDRDTWRVLQLWYIRAFRERIHREWLNQAVLAGEISAVGIEQYARDPRKYLAAKFKARGWGWVDPTKEVAAYKEAVRAGFTTQTAVIAQSGNGADLEDVLDERRQELDQAKQLGLAFDTETTPAQTSSSDPPPDPPPEPDEDDEDDQGNQRGLRAI
jgi:lambda family phage portal protein